MIAAWMLYTLLLTLVLGIGALLLEKTLHALGRPSRRIWVLAMVGGVTVPGFTWLMSSGSGLEIEGAGPALAPMAEALAVAGPVLFELDGPLLWGWLAVSGLLAGLVALSAFRVQAGRRRWDRTTVEGVPVRVSRDVGPAVVGLLRSEIVLPRWVLESDRVLKDLILLHEREHVREGDHRLLALGLLLTALMPWNLALFWLAHRLRLAVEMDCDARVLRGSGFDVRTYGTLLLEVGRRRGRGVLPLAAFSRPRSLLERRIQRMTSRSGKGATALGLGLAAALVLASAAYIPVPPAAGEVYAMPGYFSCTQDATATARVTENDGSAASRDTPASLEGPPGRL